MFYKATIATLLACQGVQLYAQDNVILLHGLMRSSKSFSTLEKYLSSNGYKVINQDYPSRDHTIEYLSLKYISQAIEKCDKKQKIHFVTHSLGGILVRYFLSQRQIPNLGSIVMLAPPNKGSEIVDKLDKFWFFRFINGPSISQLGTAKDSLPNVIGPANTNVGIIAGRISFNLLLSCLLPGKDDGKVTVENTKLEGMSDHIVLPTSHIFIMKNKKVLHQINHFLKSGAFDHGN